MKREEAETDFVHLLSLSMMVWLAYLCVLAAVDHLLYPEPVFGMPFYLINGFEALAVLGLAVWPRGRNRFGRAFLPLVIVLMVAVPIVVTYMGLRGSPPTPARGPEAITLRLLPIMIIALVLVAWQYGWTHVVIYTMGVACLTLGMHAVLPGPARMAQRPPGFPDFPPGAQFRAPVIVLIIQTVSFLLVGYFISTLMNRLRAQRTSLEQANAQLRHQAGALEDLTVSRERNRLARELHDTLAHTLSGLSVQLEAAKAYFDVDVDAARKLVAKSLEATRSGLTETRRALKALRASPLDDLGLLLALRKMAEEYAARARLELHLSLPDQLDPLSPHVDQAVYRVAQEAIANTVYHANAHNLTVNLHVEEDGLSLVVSDDGSGFKVRGEEVAGHFGLAGMRERAQLSGGELSIDSRPGEGTTILLRIRSQRE